MKNRVRKINSLHNEAMELSDRSFVARRYGNREDYLRYTRLALEKEAAAADLMVGEDVEPTRSVLHRSAATLAWRCEEYDRAKRLIYRALAGNPPSEIEYELYDLLGNVKLALSSIHLSDKHLRLTLDGSDIAFGRAPARTLANRIIGIEEMLQATAKTPIPLFYDSVGAASFYVDLTLSAETQQTLPGFDNFDEIVEPLIQRLGLLNRGETEILKEAINNPANYSEFIQAARKLAPDGNAISTVNLQARIAGRVQAVSFERSQEELKQIPIPRVPEKNEPIHATAKTFRKIGLLLRADGHNESVCELETDRDGTWIIEVREDIMPDLLGKYWKRRVEIEGRRMRRARSLKRLHLASLENIREIPAQPEQPYFNLP